MLHIPSSKQWLWLLLLFLSTSGTQAQTFSYGDPSAAEQAFLEAINRARANPVAEAQRLKIALNEGLSDGTISTAPKQPLVMNALLLTTARNHTQDMIARQFFGHVNPDGVTSGQRARAAGFNFSDIGENIAFTATTAPLSVSVAALEMHDNLFIDQGFQGRGHRTSIMNNSFKEVGVGVQITQEQQNGNTFNAGYSTTTFGTSLDESRSFITGVVYDDKNRDGLYTAGEGIGGVEVKISSSGERTSTATAGGYGIPLTNGQHTVTFTYNGNTISHTVMLVGSSIKQDVLLSEFSNTGNGDGNTSSANTLPALGDSTGFDGFGNPTTKNSRFTGGIAVNNAGFQRQVIQNLSDTVNVTGIISVDANDAGQKADIFVYARLTVPGVKDTLTYMLGEGLRIEPWDSSPNTLIAFQPSVSLQASQQVVMYTGKFILPGALKVFFGYRLQNGTLVLNSDPIDITINP